jgi:rhodanese-related sulfurtransferase
MAHSPRFEQLTADAKSRIREIDATDAAQQLRDGAVLIDVREKEEFDQGRAAGAKHLSKGVIEVKIEKEIPALDTPIICYCGGGNRSALVADNLQKMGYTNVQSMTGGFKAWKAAQLPTDS